MFKLMKKKTATMIGLDIGCRMIKIAVLSCKNKSLSWVIDEIPTPQGALEQGLIIQVDPVAEAIRELVVRCRIKNQAVVAIISGENVFSRIIQLPKMSDPSVAAALKWSGDEFYSAANLPEMVRSHWILDPTAGEETQMQVLLAAIQGIQAERIYTACSLAGLQLAAVEIPPLAVRRLLTKEFLLRSADLSGIACLAVLQLGWDGGEWMVFINRQLIAWRFYPLDNLAVDQPDGTDRFAGLSPMISEIRLSFQEINGRPLLIVPEKVLLIGDAAGKEGLAEFLQANLGLPTSIAAAPSTAGALALGSALRGSI